MNDRHYVVSEYFKLRLLLNTGNKTANEATEIVFEIVEKQGEPLQFIAKIKDLTNRQSIILCLYSKALGWEWAGYSGLNNLEKYCSQLLQESFKKLNINKSSKLITTQRQIICEIIGEDLRSLGISKT